MGENHGVEAEDSLESIATRLIGESLVLRSPVLHEGKKTRELADFIFLIDDVMVVVQSKSLDISVEDLDDMIMHGRVNKRYEKALSQINTTLNAERLKSKVSAKTVDGVEFEFDWSVVKTRIGIITLNIPDEKYDDPEFRFQFPKAYVKHRNVDVHTFILRDLVQMQGEINTAGDLLVYLNTRSKCFSSGKFILCNELDFFAIFKSQYDVIEQTLADENHVVSVAPGCWEGYLERYCAERVKRNNACLRMAVVVNIMRILKSAINYSARDFDITRQDSAVTFLKVAGMLSKLTSVEASELSKRIDDKYLKSSSVDQTSFFLSSTTFRIGYLIVFSNDPSRDRRRDTMAFMSISVCHEDLPFDTLLCIMGAGQRLRENCLDCLAIDKMFAKSEFPIRDFQSRITTSTVVSRDEWSMS